MISKALKSLLLARFRCGWTPEINFFVRRPRYNKHKNKIKFTKFMRTLATETANTHSHPTELGYARIPHKENPFFPILEKVKIRHGPQRPKPPFRPNATKSGHAHK